MEFNATFIVSIISFILFVVLMNILFYAPITRIVQEREEKLKNNYDDALWFNQAAEGIKRVRDQKLAKTEDESRKIIANKIEDYNARSKSATTEAATKAAEDIKIRKESLNIAKENAKQELKNNVQDLAKLISEKVMGIDIKETNGAK